MASPVNSSDRAPIQSSIKKDIADTADTVKKTFNGFTWQEIGGWAAIGVGVIGVAVAVAAVVSAATGNRNIFQMGNQLGFVTTPLALTATLGTVGFSTIVFASATSIGGGTYFVVQARKEAKERQEGKQIIPSFNPEKI